MRPDRPPSPTYSFSYRTPPTSGNAINGLGERAFRRARHVFHNASGEELAWRALDDFFSYINPWGVVRHILVNAWRLRRREGPVAREKREVVGPAAMAREIKAKAKAKELGAGLVGLTRVAVLTDLPLPYDSPVDIGVEDLCLRCRRCVEDCPPDAIYDDKQLVRGGAAGTWTSTAAFPISSRPAAAPSVSRSAPGASPGAGRRSPRRC